MNAHRMDPETVERLLVGPVADPQDGPEALVRILTAVRAAPRPSELTGEGAALRAYRMARAGSLPVPAAPPRRVLAGLLSAKLALAGLLVAASGGVALAAATGTLPGPLGGGGGEVTTPPPSATTDARPSPTGGADPSTAAPGGTPAGPDASPALRGLCTAYREQPGEERRRALENPRFAELLSAAGDRDRVAGYCDRLLDGRDQPGTPGASQNGRPGTPSTSRAPSRPERTPATPATPSNPSTPATPGAPTATTHRPVGPAGQVQATVGPGTH